MNDLLLEPLKYYDDIGKKAHEENTRQHFKDLLDKSGVDVEENRRTVKEYNGKVEEINKLSKKLSKYKFFKVMLIIGIVLGSIICLFSLSLFGESVISGMLFILLGGIFLAGSIWPLVAKVNPTIKDTDSVKEGRVKESEEILQRAWEQMRPMNALFTDYDALRLIEKTIPEFSFDDKFTRETERLFVKDYDFLDLQDDESSMVDTLSGSFAGNPFLFGRRVVHSMGSHTYHGSLRISWVESYRDSNGDIRERTRSQTLHASLTRPKPFFNYNTFLAYGNQAAPNLSFSRTHEHSEDLSEKALQRKIKKGENALRKQAEKAMKQGGNFQEMANSEFDVLFGANDRDNEVQFRLMYTPLAQLNTVALIKDKNYYGDDFDFTKRCKFNVITSDHAQSWNMSTVASNYYSYDVDESLSKFVNFNVQFFRSVFFDFAPLLSIPAYAEEPCASLDDVDDYSYNYTYYEHEVMANTVGYQNFVHDESATEAILKTELLSKDNSSDRVAVTAYSYATVERIDYVPVKGGDGYYHDVPVYWTEYIPVSKTTNVAVADSREAEEQSEGSVRYHGMDIYCI